MKICDASGRNMCGCCGGTPPTINGYSRGDICRYTAEKIMDHLKDGGMYEYNNGKLYHVELYYDSTLVKECDDI